GLLRRSNEAVLIASLVLGVLAVGLSFVLISPEVRPTFWVALGVLPIFGLVLLRQSAMQGLRHVVLAQVPELLLRPLLLLVAVAVTYVVFGKFTATGAMALNIVVAMIAFVVGA